MSDTRYCRLRGKNVEIAESKDAPRETSLICTESYPVTDCCKQYDCRWHFAMSGAVFLAMAKGISSEGFLRSRGAKDYCTQAREQKPGSSKPWWQFWR